MLFIDLECELNHLFISFLSQFLSQCTSFLHRHPLDNFCYVLSLVYCHLSLSFGGDCTVGRERFVAWVTRASVRQAVEAHALGLCAVLCDGEAAGSDGL